MADRCLFSICTNHHMRISYYIIALVILTLAGDAAAQDQPSAGRLSRNDVVVDRAKPSIFLCRDRGKSDGSSMKPRFRLTNNLVWAVLLESQKAADKLEVFKLSNGTRVGAVAEGTVSYLSVLPESGDSDGAIDSPYRSSLTWLRSAGSTYFPIPEPIAKSQELYIGFKYEWEIIGSAGFESDSPIHRVYFTLDRLSDCS